MSTLVVKNLPEDLHAALKERAKRNHRSLNKEALAILEHEVQGRMTSSDLSPPLRLPGGRQPSVEEIEAAIEEGRE